MYKTGPNVDLTWMLNDLVGRVKAVEQAIVLSADGLLMAASQGMPRDDAEHLAAVASGMQSLAKGAGTRFRGGAVQQTIIEMESSYLFVTAAGPGACLALLASEDADVGLVAYEMAMLVARAARHLAAPARRPGPPPGDLRS